MGYAIALPFPKIGSLVEKVKENYKILDSKNLDRLYGFFKTNWWKFSEEKRDQLAPIRLYLNFKNKEFCDVLQTLKRINKPDLAAQVNNYVWKRNNPLFSVQEKIKQILKKPTEYNLIESKLIEFANRDYNPSLLKKNGPVVQVLPRKYLKDLTRDEKEDIVIRRMYKEDINNLIRDFYLIKDKKIVYQAVSKYNRKEKRKYINRIKGFLDNHDYKAREILYMANKIKRKTFGRLSDDEKREISWMNKEGIRAKDLVKKYNLSGTWVVYLANMEQKKIREQMIKHDGEQKRETNIIPSPTIYGQPAGHVYPAQEIISGIA